MSDPAAKSDILRSHFHLAVTAAVVFAFLVIARGFLVPLAVAVMVWSLLNALIGRLEALPGGHHLVLRHRAAAAVAVVLVVAVGVVLLEVLSRETLAIAEAAPDYLKRIDALSEEWVRTVGARVAATVEQLAIGINLSASVSGAVGAAGWGLVNLILVALYVGFLFVEQKYLATKVEALLASSATTDKVRSAMTSAAAGLNRYIWILAVIGLIKVVASYGVLVAVGLDFATTWALLTFVLNFIPTIGPTLAVIMPATLALLQFDTPLQAAVLVLGLGLIQFIVGNIIQPTFLGRSLNLSPLVIILALAGWGAIWGVVGVFLAVPIMAMVTIVCARVPDLRWVAIILSKDGDVDGEAE
jgi:AI-2 transport protein TqsA